MRIFKRDALLKFGLTFTITVVAVSVASAATYANDLSIDKAGKIRDCGGSSACKEIEPSGDLKKAIDDGYENLAVVDIYKDGNKEIAATSGGGDRCSKFFYMIVHRADLLP